jgi:hypothetical protein
MDRERSELSEREPQTPLGVEQWYSFSFFLPFDFPAIYPVKTALGQFHQRGAKSPPLMFQYGIPKGYKEPSYYLDLNATNLGHFPLISEETLRGRWHDVLVNAVWSNGDDGLLVVWVDDVLKYQLKGKNTLGSGSIYFKYGIYRSFVSRYTGVGKVPSQIAYFDEVKRGNTREEVAIKRK